MRKFYYFLLLAFLIIEIHSADVLLRDFRQNEDRLLLDERGQTPNSYI